MRAQAPLVVALLAGGCSIETFDLTGKQCPCVTGWVCDESSNTCVRDLSLIDAPGSDGIPPIDAPGSDGVPPIDGPPSVSCLGDVFGASLYTSALDDLTGWMTVGDGTWSSASGEALQTLTTALNTYAYPTGAPSLTDYRLALRARRTGGTGTILASFRVQVGTNNRYRCSWRPTDGSLKLEAPRPQGDYRSFAETQVAVGAIPGYDPAAPITLEAEASGNTIRCCIREIPNAFIISSNTLYADGPPAIETVTAAGGFDSIQVNAP